MTLLELVELLDRHHVHGAERRKTRLQPRDRLLGGHDPVGSRRIGGCSVAGGLGRLVCRCPGLGGGQGLTLRRL